MYLPSTYSAQLAFMFGSMVCWGSWANTVKLTPGWRFQSFYWDYVIGVLLGSFLWGLVLGGGAQFLHGMRTASGTAILLAVLAGIVFNAAARSRSIRSCRGIAFGYTRRCDPIVAYTS